MLLKPNQFKKLYLSATSLLVSLGFATFQPAAEAAYSRIRTPNGDFTGVFSFESERDNFSLTGIGAESISLNQLDQEVVGLQFDLQGPAYLPFQFVRPQPVMLYIYPFDEILLDFLNGELVGVTSHSGRGGFAGGETRPGSCCSAYFGEAYFTTEKDVLRLFMDITVIFTRPPDFTDSQTSSYTQQLGQYPLLFETITPIQPIPEPTTLLGVGLAAALGVAGKRIQKGED